MARSTILGNIGSFVGNALGGVRGRQNAAAWVVAFTAAYFLWIKPERDAMREEEARAILRREADLHRYVERTRPVADPQERGLIRGKPKEYPSDR
ncbi:hypothetical protein Mapa_004310 [Marchantia paleacea]|nr:hypothetical protein Mapa_004310 [Marchantia paleacea]